MKTFIVALLLLTLSFCIYWLRVLPFREKKTNQPKQIARAKLVARNIQKGTQRSGRSQGMGYSFLLTFEKEDGETLELYAYDHEYGALREGMEGTLTWKGPYFVSFQEKEET